MPISIEQSNWLIEQVYQNFFDGHIKESRDELVFRCPFCGDSAKSKLKRRGHLSKTMGIYHCFNCGYSCDGFELISKLTNESLKDIKRNYFKTSMKFNNQSLRHTLATTSNTEIITNKRLADIDIKPTWQELNQDCIDYLNSRFIFNAPGWNKRDILYYDSETDRLVIPWRNNGKIDYYQLRALRCYQSPKYLFPKGAAKAIYGLDKIDEFDNFICFTEGVLDAIWVKNCVAIGGIFPNSGQMQELKSRGAELIWVSDNFWIDNSAKKEIIKMAKITPRLKIFNWPKDCPYKDINEWICASKNFNQFYSADFIKSNCLTLAQAYLKMSCSSK